MIDENRRLSDQFETTNPYKFQSHVISYNLQFPSRSDDNDSIKNPLGFHIASSSHGRILCLLRWGSQVAGKTLSHGTVALLCESFPNSKHFLKGHFMISYLNLYHNSAAYLFSNKHVLYWQQPFIGIPYYETRSSNIIWLLLSNA